MIRNLFSNTNFTLCRYVFDFYISLFSVVRFSGAHSHYFMNDFLQSVANRYQESKRPKDFVMDLLRLRVSGLLAIDPGEHDAGEEVQKSFKNFLQSFIRRNALKQTLLREMSIKMLVCKFYSPVTFCSTNG